MKHNLGIIDRIVRIMLAAIVGVLYFTNVINGPIAIILLVVCAILIVTSFIGFCPIYALFGWSSTPKKPTLSKTKA